jgi:hypothetical protein
MPCEHPTLTEVCDAAPVRSAASPDCPLGAEPAAVPLARYSGPDTPFTALPLENTRLPVPRALEVPDAMVTEPESSGLVPLMTSTKPPTDGAAPADRIRWPPTLPAASDGPATMLIAPPSPVSVLPTSISSRAAVPAMPLALPLDSDSVPTEPPPLALHESDSCAQSVGERARERASAQ